MTETAIARQGKAFAVRSAAVGVACKSAQAVGDQVALCRAPDRDRGACRNPLTASVASRAARRNVVQKLADLRR